MTALLLFLMLHLFAVAAFIYRNKLIDGMQANSKVKAVRALAYWESQLINAKTAHEKMVYLRMVDDVKASIINDMQTELSTVEDTSTVSAVDYSKNKETDKLDSKAIDTSIEAANVVNLSERRRAK